MRVVVTGGCGGIGDAVRRQLGAEGHQPIVVDVNPPAVPGIPYLRADARERGAVGAAVREAYARYGPLDAVVNSLGVYDAVDLAGFTWEAFDRNVAVNVAAPIEAALALVECRKPDQRAKVVTIGSAGARTPSRDLAYATSKAAVEGMTRSLAYSLAPAGICVFCVAPGIVDTPMSRRMAPERSRAHAERSLLGRAAAPEEVAALVCYLVTGPTEPLSGAVLNASGGLTP